MSWPRTERHNQDRSRRAIPTRSAPSDQKWTVCSTASWEDYRHSQACLDPVEPEVSPLHLTWMSKRPTKRSSSRPRLPGLDEKDISVTVENGILTIQGEKKLDYDEE